MTTFEEVRPVADAVLFEGYVLYPYRASDPKNRVRWQFGVVMPPAMAAMDPSERTMSRTECLVEGASPTVAVRIRFLHVQRRTVQARSPGSPDGFVDVEELADGDAAYRAWDEAVCRELDVVVPVADAVRAPQRVRLEVPGGVEVDEVGGGRLVRTRRPLRLELTAQAADLPGPYQTRRLALVLANETHGPLSDDGDGTRREQGLRGALVAAHLLLRATDGAFVSLVDPPEWARGYAEECHQDGLWPVLAGAPGVRDVVLASPIILYDHPSVAPESSADFFDATEIDELLSLRTLTLTESEKREARATDPRTAALLDRVELMPPELMDRLHGAVRYLRATTDRPTGRPGPEVDEGIAVGGVVLRVGSRVVLRPGSRAADAQDMFLAGRTARVTRLLHDVDGGDHLAVVLDDDPGQDLAVAQARFLYFAPDEVEPLGAAT